ncbi:MAG TPA: aminotransferase, partial [Thermoplasmata archaeon]|nr:aminotransferase [Thermoplasmata archaeon]
MTFDPETATFLIAGPVRIHPRVLRAMSYPSVNHRGDYFHGIVAEIRELLPVLFGAKGHQAILSGSGSAGLEAVYSALVPADGRTLVLTNGNFGERSDLIARRYSSNVTTLSAPWGQHIPLAAAETELEKGDVGAVCVVHNETSVGLA